MFCVFPNLKDDWYHDLFVLKNCTGNFQSGCDSGLWVCGVPLFQANAALCLSSIVIFNAPSNENPFPLTNRNHKTIILCLLSDT